MRYIHTLTVSLFICLISCNSPKDQKLLREDPPKALAEKDLTEISSKRSDGDLVDNIYDEVIDKSPELKDLENKISKIEESKNDSLSPFNKYNEKKKQFYSSADNHIFQINDSILRKQIKAILDSSLKNYKTSTQKHVELMKAVDFKTANLNDIHVILKLSKALPVMEQYQKTNLPATRTIDNLINDYDKAIQKTKTLTKTHSGS